MNDYNYDMISRYVDGEMNAEELKAFEEQLQTDAALQEEVDLYKELNLALKIKFHPDENEPALRNTMEELRADYFTTTRAKVIPMRRFRWAAISSAAVLILAVLITIWSPWKKDLYNQYAYVQMPGVEERGNSTDSLIRKASQEFNSKDFEQSLPYFESILNNEPQNSFARYYYAIAMLQSNKTQRSRTELMQLYQGNSIFHDDAAFYMALSYVKEKNKLHCREWLTKIPQGSDVYDKAQELLRKLQ